MDFAPFTMTNTRLVHTNAIQSNSLGVINQNKGYFGYGGNAPPLTEIPK